MIKPPKYGSKTENGNFAEPGFRYADQHGGLYDLYFDDDSVTCVMRRTLNGDLRPGDRFIEAETTRQALDSTPVRGEIRLYFSRHVWYEQNPKNNPDWLDCIPEAKADDVELPEDIVAVMRLGVISDEARYTSLEPESLKALGLMPDNDDEAGKQK